MGYSQIDPYLSEEQPYVGYITQSIYVKPTTPPTTIAVIIGNFDGRPGNKRDLRLYLTQTPDEELPRRSLELGWTRAAERGRNGLDGGSLPCWQKAFTRAIRAPANAGEHQCTSATPVTT